MIEKTVTKKMYKLSIFKTISTEHKSLLSDNMNTISVEKLKKIDDITFYSLQDMNKYINEKLMADREITYSFEVVYFKKLVIIIDGHEEEPF